MGESFTVEFGIRDVGDQVVLWVLGALFELVREVVGERLRAGDEVTHLVDRRRRVPDRDDEVVGPLLEHQQVVVTDPERVGDDPHRQQHRVLRHELDRAPIDEGRDEFVGALQHLRLELADPCRAEGGVDDAPLPDVLGRIGIEQHRGGPPAAQHLLERLGHRRFLAQRRHGGGHRRLARPRRRRRQATTSSRCRAGSSARRCSRSRSRRPDLRRGRAARRRAVRRRSGTDTAVPPGPGRTTRRDRSSHSR